MIVGITGKAERGLSSVIGNTLSSTPYKGETIEMKYVHTDDILMNKGRFFGFDQDNPNHFDVLINNAHDDFAQTKIVDIVYNNTFWAYDSSKYLINIGSRASQPNISKGYLYAAQKASLTHYCNNLTYNSDKQFKMTTINLGLLNHDELPSVTQQDVASLIYYLITSYPSIEIPEMTIQAHANYCDVQSDKAMLLDLERNGFLK